MAAKHRYYCWSPAEKSAVRRASVDQLQPRLGNVGRLEIDRISRASTKLKNYSGLAGDRTRRRPRAHERAMAEL